MNIRKIDFSLKKSKKNNVKALKSSTVFMLVGNPNTGKTTLFNSITCSNEHVGNWHGVTVSEKEKPFSVMENKFVLVDLPGIYSLTPLSFEEEVATEYIFANNSFPIINICDINNLKRNLFLTMQLKELSSEIIVFVNTFKNKKNNKKIKEKIENAKKILNKLDVKYFIGNAENKNDVNSFKKYLLNLKYSFNKNINKIKEKYNKNNNLNFQEDNKKIFLKINSYFSDTKSYDDVYGKSKLDKILLNKFLAFPIFFAVLFLIFYLTFFSFGAWLCDLLRYFIQNIIGGQVVGWLKGVCEVEWFIDLVETGVFGGVGSILSFLPQVVLLFFFLSLLEESGYLSRVAFLFEDIFSKVGLSGKSVYTLLMGFGCSTTASLTARNMEDKNSKIKTAILTPYMSCSAKLPIYAIIGGAFFGASNVFVIFGIYLLGVVIALLLSLILEHKVLKSNTQSFILEFPSYKLPSIKRVLSIITENVKLFLIRIGTIIFALNMVIWILQSFSFTFKFVSTNGGKSMLQSIGEIVAPVFAPLGFGNWGATSALIAGLVAKEIIVSSIAMFNGVNVSGDGLKTQTMSSIMNPLSVVYFTPASALSFMVFCLLYAPCFATISVFKKEIGVKWTIIAIVLQFTIAYFMSYLFFNLYKVFDGSGSFNFIFILIGILTIFVSFIFVINKIRNKSLCSYCKGNKNCEKCKRK